MAKRRSKYERSLEATRATRGEVSQDLLPLFDHCIHLAEDAHRRGNFKRAGLDLLHARRLRRYKHTRSR